MKVTRFDGTPEEFKAVAHLFGDSPLFATNGPSAESGAELPQIEPRKAIRSMLTRLSLSDGQLAAYKALANGKLEYHEFLKHAGRSAAEMAGVLGALGRRINNTEEIHQARLPGNTNAVFKWEKEGGMDYISLTPYALEALKAEKII